MKDELFLINSKKITSNEKWIIFNKVQENNE